MLKTLYYILIIIGLGIIIGCDKKEFLDDKPNTDLFVPTTLEDFQLLLDNYDVMSETPAWGELSADNYYLLDSLVQQSLIPPEQYAYTWEKEIYKGVNTDENWNFPYRQVFYANVVLEGLAKLSVTANNEQQWNTLKGTALFIRAYAFHNLAQIFAPLYDITSTESDTGIPIRLTSDINEPTNRSTVKQTYDQILSDLNEAKKLLPVTIPFGNLNRPSKPAAFAILARVYLTMREYAKAKLHADSCLQLYNTLMDYNRINTLNPIPFNRSNSETLYQSRLFSKTNVVRGFIFYMAVDSVLYRSYDSNDLRRSAFYFINPGTGLPITKGSYNGSFFAFSGPATDEVYLIRAECYAREQNINAAMNDLNILLQNRMKTGTFVPYSAATRDEALQLILTERRKELAFRGLRWSDIRRLNKEGLAIYLKHTLNGLQRELNPNDPKYVLPIPPDVITLSGIPQNPR